MREDGQLSVVCPAVHPFIESSADELKFQSSLPNDDKQRVN